MKINNTNWTFTCDIKSFHFCSLNTLLGDSLNIVKQKFLYFENKFNSQPKLRKAFMDFMHEYLDSNHMTLNHEFILDNKHYYLPHHTVIKPSSSTTCLRVVFNSSSKITSGIFLNIILCSGLKLQSDICNVILHFYEHNIVFSSNIWQMYSKTSNYFVEKF